MFFLRSKWCNLLIFQCLQRIWQLNWTERREHRFSLIVITQSNHRSWFVAPRLIKKDFSNTWRDTFFNENASRILRLSLWFINQRGSKSHLDNRKQRRVIFSLSWCFESRARRGKGLLYGIKTFASRRARIHAFGALCLGQQGAAIWAKKHEKA